MTKTVALAESITGGHLAHLITLVPGASLYFMGSVVAYSNQAKVDLLGVSEKSLEDCGAVSEEVALEMAEGARRIFKSDIAGAVTGIAGPTGGSVGRVCFALATHEGARAWSMNFDEKSRIKIIKAASKHLLAKLKELMIDA